MEDDFYLTTVNSGCELKECIAQLEYDDIESMAEERIFMRGLDYFRAGSVSNLSYEDDCITASVDGNYANHYKVHIYKNETDLLGQCNCPYDDVCKHIIAVLLTLREKPESQVLQTSEDNDEVFLSYISALSKNELIDLVKRFAPANFRREIAFKEASLSEISPLLTKLKREIFITVNDEELLRDPDSFAGVALEYLDEMKAFVNRAPEEVFEIVFDFAEQIERKSDEGDLYQNSRYGYYDYGEAYFDFDLFSGKVIELINVLEDSNEQADAVLDFAQLCQESEYYYLPYQKLDIGDKNLLKDHFDEIGTLEFFYYIRDLLDFEEQERCLKHFEPESVFENMVELYMKHGKKEDAIDYVESLLQKSFKVEYANFLIKVATIPKERLRQFVEQAIAGRCHRTYDFIVTYIDKCDLIEELEALFREKCCHQYYHYLEKEKRIDEMYDLLGKVQGNRLEFFQKYKKHYPNQATAFFKNAINEALPYTGNEYYSQIANYLKHLSVLIPKEESSHIIYKLKTEYKRRRNFVKILNEKFPDDL